MIQQRELKKLWGLYCCFTTYKQGLSLGDLAMSSKPEDLLLSLSEAKVSSQMVLVLRSFRTFAKKDFICAFKWPHENL